jgi:hypothetical protein
VGYKGQRANFRVKQLIMESLSRGEPVVVLVAVQAGLIQKCAPLWNIMGVS